MLELLALALFQLASFTGSFETITAPKNETGVVTNADTGNGGWGHDRAPVKEAPVVVYTGNGGWGHD
jgi:hypothetical protein